MGRSYIAFFDFRRHDRSDPSHAARRRREQPHRRAPRQTDGPARAGHRVPQRFPSWRLRRRPAGPVRRCRAVDCRSAGRCRPPREAGRPPDGQAGDGQGQLRADPGRIRPHPAVPAVEHAGRDLRRLQGLGHRRHRRRRGQPDPDPHRGTVGQGRRPSPADQVAAPAAGQVAWPVRRRAALSPALRGPDRHAGSAGRVHQALAHHPCDPRVAGCPAFPGSRDADDALHPRRRCGQAVHHAPQRAGPGPVPARGTGVVPEAPGRRRTGARLRDQPQLPQRRCQHAAQPRVHDARAVRGLRHVHRDHGPHRGGHPRCRPRGPGHRPSHLGRSGHRPGAGVPPLAHG